MKSIFERRSIRKFKDEAVSREDIIEIIKAASAAPSAKNRQPWKYIVYTGSSKESLLKAMEKGLHRERKENPILPASASGLADAVNTMRIMVKAPVLIVIINIFGKSPFIQIDRDERVSEICNTLSIGASVENLILAAHERRLGTLWVANTCFAYPELMEEIEGEGQLAGCVVVGKSDENPPARPRKALEEILEFRN